MSLSFPLSRKLLTRFQEVTASWEVGSDIWEVGGPIFGGGRSNRLLIRVAGTHWTGLGFAKVWRLKICEKSIRNNHKNYFKDDEQRGDAADGYEYDFDYDNDNNHDDYDDIQIQWWHTRRWGRDWQDDDDDDENDNDDVDKKEHAIVMVIVIVIQWWW